MAARVFKIEEPVTGIGQKAKALKTWMTVFKLVETILTRYESLDMYTSFRYEISETQEIMCLFSDRFYISCLKKGK